MPLRKSPKSLKTKKTSKRDAHKSVSTPIPYRGWVQDVSLEVIVPGHHTFAPGDRSMELSANLMSEPLQQQDTLLYSLVVIVHLKVQNTIISLLEIRYSKVVDKTQISQTEKAIAEELYQEVKSYLEQLLAMSGHTPPLPQSLEQ